MFREHIAVGAIISMAVVVAAYFYAFVTDPLLLAILFGITVVGSFLPDVDSDSGLPFYLVFGIATLAATGLVALATLDSPYAGDWRYLVGIPAAGLVFFWFIIGGVIKKCTHHRGMFHSIPALGIASLLTLLAARYFGLDDTAAFVFAGAMGIGFASHLILDELHAGISLDGIPFIPKKSLGTALKFFSSSRGANLAAYILLGALVYSAYPMFALAQQLYYNDSDVVGIEGAPPPNPIIGDPGSGGSGGSGGATGGGSAGGSGTPGGEGAPPGEAGAGDGSGAGGPGSGSGGSGAGGTGGTPDDVLNELINSGAITGLSFGSDGSFGASGAGGLFTITGFRVREALRYRSDLRDILSNWRELRARGASLRDIGLMAVAAILSDTNVEDVTFFADRFDITYRSRGYLVGLFPWTFPVRIAIIPQAPEGGRVTVKLPWYQFFVREFFTKQGLAAEIESAMKAAIAEAPEGEDQSQLLLGAVTELLRQRVGTVGDSILLGG